jgi:hypothetical protein
MRADWWIRLSFVKGLVPLSLWAQCPEPPVQVKEPRFQCQWAEARAIPQSERWVLELPEDLGWRADGTPQRMSFEFFSTGFSKKLEWGQKQRRFELPCGASMVRFRLQIFTQTPLRMESFVLLDPRPYLKREVCPVSARSGAVSAKPRPPGPSDNKGQ